MRQTAKNVLKYGAPDIPPNYIKSTQKFRVVFKSLPKIVVPVVTGDGGGGGGDDDDDDDDEDDDMMI
jgi:hypothetical protein